MALLKSQLYHKKFSLTHNCHAELSSIAKKRKYKNADCYCRLHFGIRLPSIQNLRRLLPQWIAYCMYASICTLLAESHKNEVKVIFKSHFLVFMYRWFQRSWLYCSEGVGWSYMGLIYVNGMEKDQDIFKVPKHISAYLFELYSPSSKIPNIFCNLSEY